VQVRGDQGELDPDLVHVGVPGGQVPDAGVLPGPDPVLDPGVGAVPGVQERQLPAGGVDGEGLIPVAVPDLERVQGRARVRVLTADDDPHPGAGHRPVGKVEHAGDLDDVGVLP